MKRHFLILIILLNICLFFVPTFSGWILEDGEYKYKNENGEYVKNSIMKNEKGKTYYLDEKGFIVKDANVEIDGKIYYFNIYGEYDERKKNNGIDVIDISTDGQEGWVEVGDNWKYIDKNGEYLIDCIKKSKEHTYYLDTDGNMARDYLYTDDKENIYYFSKTGAMVEHIWVAISGDKIEDPPFEAETYYMYFQNNGKAVKGKLGEAEKKTIEGKTYIFDEDGIMLTGWITEDGEHLDSSDSDEWYSGDAVYFAYEDGSLAEGWLKWQNGFIEDGETNINDEYIDENVLYFYFDPKTFKKKEGKKERINKKDYYFEKDTGRMLTGWEYLEENFEREKEDDRYERLEYIQSDGTQYIDSLYKHNSSTKAYIEVAGVGDERPGYIYGSGTTQNFSVPFADGMGFCFSNDGGGSYGIVSCSGNNYSYKLFDYHNKKLEVSIDKNNCIVKYRNKELTNLENDGSLVEYSFNRNDAIFGFCMFSVVAKTSAKLFYLKISDSTGVVREFVPCKLKMSLTDAYGNESASGTYGLWDKVEDKFYPKKVGNDFVASSKYTQSANLSTNKSINKHNDREEGANDKSKWVYDVPSVLISESDNEDENKQWFYTNNNGNIILDKEVKINNKTYLFDKNGIMQTSLIIKKESEQNSKFGYDTNYIIERVDLESTSYEDFIKQGKYYIKDDPIPFDPYIDLVEGHENDRYYREDGIKMCFNGNRIPFNIFYFGDDGAKVEGDNIEIQFTDGVYTFASDKKGALYGFKNNKYYTNGFINKANENVGYGIFIDYSALNTRLLGDDSIITKLRNLNPKFYNYNNYICEKTGIDENTKGESIESVHTDLNKYYVHYPLLSVLCKGYNDILSVTDLSYYNKNIIFVVDKNGKKKNKGVYKDKNDNYWIINNNKELVGIFSVPVKWGKVDGKEVPMYKSIFFEIDAKGERIEKEKYMPFFTKDINGNSELDYVYDIDDDYIVNAVIGNFDMGMN